MEVVRMTVTDWIQMTTGYYQENGVVEGTRHTAKNTWHSVLGRIDPHIGGWNIYADDWDLLIIVDACRADLMQEVAPQYDWLPDEIEVRQSRATATRPWMKRTFTDENAAGMAETDYVVGNPYSSALLDEKDFNTLDEVHQYAWDADIGTVRPRPVTDRAIDTHRSGDGDRLLVHYLPPHFPSIPDHLGYNMHLENWEDADADTGADWDGIWPAARNGEISSERIWQAYRANLEHVLDDIELLLQNVDAENAILASDHGNALGEWWTWGHPPDIYVPVNRRVPYIDLTASDEETRMPTLERGSRQESDGSETDTVDVDEQLEALGYA